MWLSSSSELCNIDDQILKYFDSFSHSHAIIGPPLKQSSAQPNYYKEAHQSYKHSLAKAVRGISAIPLRHPEHDSHLFGFGCVRPKKHTTFALR